MKYLILTLAIVKSILFTGCFGISEKDNYSNMETVANVDIERFMGDWYVIGNIPTFIEKGATNAIESYKLGANGRIETTFTFFKDSPNGEKKTYKPTGFIKNKETNAEWRMLTASFTEKDIGSISRYFQSHTATGHHAITLR